MGLRTPVLAPAFLVPSERRKHLELGVNPRHLDFTRIARLFFTLYLN